MGNFFCNEIQISEQSSRPVEPVKSKSIYDYELIYEFSQLKDDEKEKVISLIKENIEKDSKKHMTNCKYITIPKYLLVSPSRYFNIGSAFTTCYYVEERWERQFNNRFEPKKVVDNSQLYSIIEDTIIKHNKECRYTIDVKMETGSIGMKSRYDYITYYKNEADKINLIYGTLPSVFTAYGKAYPIIQITLHKVF